MKKSSEWRAAAAVTASAAGTAFSTGRETVLFFSQTGRASWLGILISAGMFAALCGGMARLARQAETDSAAGTFLCCLRPKWGKTAAILHMALMLVLTGVMIVFAGRLTALALPVHCAPLLGMLISSALAAAMNLGKRRAFGGFSVTAVGACLLFFAALLADSREIVIRQDYFTKAELWGSVPAAVVMAVLSGALNAAAAAGTAARCGRTDKIGWKAGVLMFVLLLLQNGAVLRADVKLLSQPAPLVILAARWGTAGYWSVLIVMGLSVQTTLTAAAGALADDFSDWTKPKRTC